MFHVFLHDLMLVVSANQRDRVYKTRGMLQAVAGQAEHGPTLAMNANQQGEAAAARTTFRAERDLVADIVSDERSTKVVQDGQDNSPSLPGVAGPIILIEHLKDYVLRVNVQALPRWAWGSQVARLGTTVEVFHGHTEGCFDRLLGFVGIQHLFAIITSQVAQALGS